MSDEPKDIVERLAEYAKPDLDVGSLLNIPRDSVDAIKCIKAHRVMVHILRAACDTWKNESKRLNSSKDEVFRLRAMLAAERAEVEARRALVQAIRRRVDAFAIRPYHESVCDAEVATDAARREFGG